MAICQPHSLKHALVVVVVVVAAVDGRDAHLLGSPEQPGVVHRAVDRLVLAAAGSAPVPDVHELGHGHVHEGQGGHFGQVLLSPIHPPDCRLLHTSPAQSQYSLAKGLRGQQ